jgi:hypothetical protein
MSAMTASVTFERRDPCSPLLRLGSSLFNAVTERRSGVILLEDAGRCHRVALTDGAITGVNGPGTGDSFTRAVRLFSLPRPRITWTDDRSGDGGEAVDPASLIVTGVTARPELFDPVGMVERIPVSTLHIAQDDLMALWQLPLSPSQRDFLTRLTIPAPLSMILWKRGLPPAQAASLLVALNLLGAWKEVWEPGFLPRTTAALRILKRAGEGADDAALLGLPPDAPDGDLDRALRRLSLDLHPDRQQGRPAEERDTAARAFALVLDAHDRMKRERRSRRQRPVTTQQPWQRSFADAQDAARRGDRRLARKHALVALSFSPPPDIRAVLAGLLQRCA